MSVLAFQPRRRPGNQHTPVTPVPLAGSFRSTTAYDPDRKY